MPLREESELGRKYARTLRDHHMSHEEVLAVARRVVRGRFRFCEEDIKEIVAQTLNALMLHLALDRPVTSLSGLVSTIAFREARKAIPPSPVAELSEATELRPDFLDRACLEKRIFQIKEFFHQHSPECLRQMAWRGAGYSTKEIAQILEIKPNTADVRWKRCREALMEFFGPSPGWDDWFRRAL